MESLKLSLILFNNINPYICVELLLFSFNKELHHNGVRSPRNVAPTYRAKLRIYSPVRICHGAWLAQCVSARLPPLWPGFDSRTRRLMWVEFVVGSHLAPRVFLRVLRFSYLYKNQHL